MERLQSHREFVAVLRAHKKVSTQDVVVHYRVDMMLQSQQHNQHGSDGTAASFACLQTEPVVSASAQPRQHSEINSTATSISVEQADSSAEQQTRCKPQSPNHIFTADNAHNDNVLNNEQTEHIANISSRRLGLAVSKSVGNAVTRNYVKRRFRHVARQYEHLLPMHCDIVLRARPTAATVPYDNLCHEIAHAFTVIARKYS